MEMTGIATNIKLQFYWVCKSEKEWNENYFLGEIKQLIGMKMFVTVLDFISATNMDLIKIKSLKIHTHVSNYFQQFSVYDYIVAYRRIMYTKISSSPGNVNLKSSCCNLCTLSLYLSRTVWSVYVRQSTRQKCCSTWNSFIAIQDCIIRFADRFKKKYLVIHQCKICWHLCDWTPQ